MNTQSLKHFLDILTDINLASFDLDNLKAIFRDQAGEELPDFLKLAQRVSFKYHWQAILVPQIDGNLTVVKHYYVTEKKLSGRDARLLIRGRGYEITWGSGSKS